MRLVLILVILLASFRAKGSHIVGGEFELVYDHLEFYQLSLILYFDQINGNPGAKDLSVTASIYRKRDNVIMFNVILPIDSEAAVSYTQPACSKGEIKTSRIRYSSRVRFPPENFSDPQGYYVVWQRCCRNYSITNIYSENPEVGTRYGGQTFYLEFPPVRVNGEAFRNSSPRLFPPLNDYACPGRAYYVDFGGIDDDGDSLAYSLVTPLNTKSADALPFSSPRPYPTVQWRPGYNLSTITGGQPDMAVSTEGLLTVTPKNQGLFVFAVMCEEFRNGIKIGELRRDFQLFVLDICPQAEPPVILGRLPGAVNFDQKNTMTLTYNGGAPEAERCIRVRVSDPDAGKKENEFSEKVSIRAIAIGFKEPSISQILPTTTNATLIDGSSQEFDICFPACPLSGGAFYEVAIIAADDACSLPLLDTLRIRVNVNIPPNAPPAFSTSDISQNLDEGETVSWPIQVSDPDGDPLDLTTLPAGFSLGNVGMAITWTALSPSSYTGLFTWDANCQAYSFADKRKFEIAVTANDQDLCNTQKQQDLLNLNLAVNLPTNDAPIIDSDLTADPAEKKVSAPIFKFLTGANIQFQVNGQDPVDLDQLQLVMSGVGFNPSDIGAVFTGASGTGNVSTGFQWQPDCAKINLSTKDTYNFRFTVVDQVNKCRIYKADTMEVEIKLVPPDNLSPELSIINLNSQISNNDNQYLVKRGQEIRLKIAGNDADTDPVDGLDLSLKNITGNLDPSRYTFAGAKGSGKVESIFSWVPECEDFSGGTNSPYVLTFRLADDRCNNALYSEQVIELIISDTPFDESRLNIPNVITANNDGLNDYFSLDDKDEAVAAVIGFPDDNCTRQFEEIRILNRWGKTVFQSRDRYFRWNAANESEGIYFYTVRFNSGFYKGSVTVTR